MNCLLNVNWWSSCDSVIYLNNLLSIGIYKNSYPLFKEIGIESNHFCYSLSPGFNRSSRVDDNILTISNTGSLSKVIVAALGLVPLTKMVIILIDNFTSTIDIICKAILIKWAPLYWGWASWPFRYNACIKNNPVILVNQYL